MTEGRLPEFLSQPALALALVGLWLVLACLLPLLPLRSHRRGVRVLVLAGVPALGWVTLLWGPGIGVAGMGLGLMILWGHPAARRSANGAGGREGTGPEPTRTPAAALRPDPGPLGGGAGEAP